MVRAIETRKLSPREVACPGLQGSSVVYREPVVGGGVEGRGRLDRVLHKGLTEKVTYEKKSKAGERTNYTDIWARTFHAEGTAGAKALRLECAQCVGGAAGKPGDGGV